MSKKIREQIDRVKNWKQFLNEQQTNEYYTTSRPMTINNFIEIEVEERDNYEIDEVVNWIKKYKITENDKLIWVAMKPYIAARYEMSAEDWDYAEEIYNKKPNDFNVEIIKSNKGFLISETDDGDEGFIFVFHQ
jgi:hypothetical protein